MVTTLGKLHDAVEDEVFGTNTRNASTCTLGS